MAGKKDKHGAGRKSTPSSQLLVLLTPAELMEAACGRPVIVRTSTGKLAEVRIPTFTEYRADEHQSRQRLAQRGVQLPPPPSDDQVMRILRPLQSEYRR